MENGIIANEKVIDITDEVTNVDLGKGYKAVALVGLTALVGVSAYKYVVKPITVRVIDRMAKTSMIKRMREMDQFVVDEVESVAS